MSRASASGGSGLTPSVLALFTSRSRGPSRAASSSRRWPSSAMSPGIAATWVYEASSRQAASSASAPQASMTSDQPRSASARASARPRPRDAPVTSAFLMPRPYGVREAESPSSIGPAGHSDEPLPHRVQSGLRAVGHELAQHVAHVRLDRLLGGRQRLRAITLFGCPRAISASTSLSRGVSSDARLGRPDSTSSASTRAVTSR